MKKIVVLFLLILLPINLSAKTYTKKECKEYAYKEVIKRGWSLKDYNNLVKLWNRESHWNANVLEHVEYHKLIHVRK